MGFTQQAGCTERPRSVTKLWLGSMLALLVPHASLLGAKQGRASPPLVAAGRLDPCGHVCAVRRDGRMRRLPAARRVQQQRGADTVHPGARCPPPLPACRLLTGKRCAFGPTTPILVHPTAHARWAPAQHMSHASPHTHVVLAQHDARPAAGAHEGRCASAAPLSRAYVAAAELGSGFRAMSLRMAPGQHGLGAVQHDGALPAHRLRVQGHESAHGARSAWAGRCTT